MKYHFKTEKILAWIGNVLAILSTLFIMFLVVSMIKLPEIKENALSEIMKTPGVTIENAQYTYDLVVFYMQAMLAVNIIFLVIAIIGTLMLNKSKASGIILIIVGILKLLLTFGTGIITSVLWIIAGVKRLVYQEDKLEATQNSELPILEELKDPYEYR